MKRKMKNWWNCIEKKLNFAKNLGRQEKGMEVKRLCSLKICCKDINV